MYRPFPPEAPAVSHVTLDQETADRLLAGPAGGAVELRLPDGRRLGRFVPAAADVPAADADAAARAFAAGGPETPFREAWAAVKRRAAGDAAA